MDLQARRCGCGAVFQLAKLTSRETRCSACDRKAASGMAKPRSAFAATSVNDLLKIMYPEPPTLEEIYGHSAESVARAVSPLTDAARMATVQAAIDGEYITPAKGLELLGFPTHAAEADRLDRMVSAARSEAFDPSRSYADGRVWLLIPDEQLRRAADAYCGDASARDALRVHVSCVDFTVFPETLNRMAKAMVKAWLNE